MTLKYLLIYYHSYIQKASFKKNFDAAQNYWGNIESMVTASWMNAMLSK